MSATADHAEPSSDPQSPAVAERRPLLRAPWLHAGAIMLLALALRMAYLSQIRVWPFFHHPILDGRTQYKWAGILLQRWGIGGPEVIAKAPLYSYFLALNQWLFGEGPPSLFSARLLQLAIGAAVCGMTYLLGRRVFGPAAGFLAGILLACYSPALFREGQLLDTALSTLLTVGFLLAFVSVLERPTDGRSVGAGLLLGLLGLARPNLLLLALLAAAMLAARAWRDGGARKAARLVGFLALAVILPILPILGRNYLLTRAFVPISRTGAINFYTGNNPDADGFSPIRSGIAWERTWYAALAATGEPTTASQEAHWRAQALGFWREQPARALALLLKKTYLYWSSYEIPNNESYDWGRAHSSVLRYVPLTFAVVGPLGLLGIALVGWRSRAAWLLTLFVAVHMAAVVLFFVCGRYRMPAVPVLCVFAGAALVQLTQLARARRVLPLAAAMLGLAVFALLVNSDLYGVRRARAANRDWYYLGQSYTLAGRDYLRAGQHERANDAFEKANHAFVQAARDDPRDADVYALLGQLEMQTGQAAAAAEHLKRSLEIAPDFATSAADLGQLYLQQGWPLDEAEGLLRTAVELQPKHVRGLATLARIHLRQSKLDQARADLRAAAAVLSASSRADTRWAQLAADVRHAADEAEKAGVELPAEVLALW